MKAEIKIPQMGESITEATIGAFLKPDGSRVKEGDELVELETEKVNQVLYAPSSGLLSWSVSPGAAVKIGEVIGFVDTEAEEEIKNEAPVAPPAPEVKEESAEPDLGEKPTSPPGSSERLMKEHFVAELKTPIPPKEYLPPPAPIASKKESGNESRRKMSKLRQTIAGRLVDSLHSAAMLTTFNEADMSAIIALRTKYQTQFSERNGVKLGFMSFFVKAVVEALKEFPDFNSYIEGDEIVTRHYYHIGIAVSSDKGLFVPVIRDCDRLSFAEIEKGIAGFAQKAREGKLAIADLEGGGFTITNGGVFGSLLSTPILNPPQVGILGMHKIMKRPIVEGDEVVIRPMMYLALSYDHRIVDGKEAVSFLVRIKEILEDPSRLLFDTDEKI